MKERYRKTSIQGRLKKKKNRITERRKKRNRCEINRRKKRKHSENECQEIENVGKTEEKAINGIIAEERKNRKK